MNRIHIYLLLLVVFCATNLAAQTIVKGKVTDVKGAAITGATVKVSKSLKVTSTKADGRFSIIVEKLPAVLVFSAIGMETKQVEFTETISKDSNFSVILIARSSDLLEEVVVNIGYGTIKKTSSTGSIARISARDISITSKVMNDKFYFSDTAALKEKMKVKSKILTAGEINDFKKWDMWKDLTENEFETYSKQWNITPKQRYSVQVVNRNFNALINIPIQLIDNETGDIIWSAKTDNTGKAELWANVFTESMRGEDYSIKCNNDYVIKNPLEFKNGINYVNLSKPCNISNKVNIAFVTDATGSMGDEIEFLKIELEDIINHTQNIYQNLEIKLASVFYRDNSDDYVTKHLDFTKDLSSIMSFIQQQNARGGGDEPEAVDSALATTLHKLSWDADARARIIFLILDAPPHDYAKQRVLTLIQEAAQMGIRIMPIACSGSSKSNEFLLRSMALATNGMYSFLTNHSGVGGNHIEPSTDKYDIELLNTVMKRMISECIYSSECNTEAKADIPMQKKIDNIANIKVYPNPTRGLIKINSDKELKEVYVCDFSGKILERINLKNKNTFCEINLDKYPNGIYYARYITSKDIWGAEKVILVH